MISHRIVFALLPAAALSAVLFSCDPKVKTADDHDAPDITIDEPISGHEYHLGDTIWLKGHVEDLSELQDITVSMIYSADTVVLWPDAPVILGNVTQYDVDHYAIDIWDVSEPATILFAATDKHDNAGSASIPIVLNH